jgi:glycosyltransferase involved in cell wall biosynthesis
VSEVPPFSLLLPVYRGDHPRFLERAFRSTVHDQSLRPAQVVIVRDGPVPPEVESLLVAFQADSPVPVDVVRLERNVGLARALTEGLGACANEIVARMDADDVSLPHRFERQVSELHERNLDMIGAGMFEFEDDSGRVLGTRTPPIGEERIARYARFHDPFNHPTVVYRKSAVHRAGGYQELGLMEDYWLFARMIHSGARVDNLAAPLVMYRVGAGAYRRRGGVRQLRAEVRLQTALRRLGFTSRTQRVRNLAVRASYRLVPVGIRRVAYRALIAPGLRSRSAPPHVD